MVKARLGKGNDLALGVGSQGREDVYLSLPGARGCHVQLRAGLRAVRIEASRRAVAPAGAIWHFRVHLGQAAIGVPGMVRPGRSKPGAREFHSP